MANCMIPGTVIYGLVSKVYDWILKQILFLVSSQCTSGFVFVVESFDMNDIFQELENVLL